MTLRDISVTLHVGTPEWPGDTPFSCTWAWQMSAGASVNVSCLTGSPHVGTHADAPLHVTEGGAAVDSLPLEAFIGPATVVDLRAHTGVVPIDDPLFARSIAGGRLLLRTGCSIADGAFPTTWPALSVEAVQLLVSRGLRLLGVDCPSVDRRESTTLEVHHALFAGGAFVLENLDLRDVDAGDYELVAPPIKIGGADAAPVRAVLRTLGGA
ncbi:MAG: cyclase family protein [Gemmatimonadaceae bacterium]